MDNVMLSGSAGITQFLPVEEPKDMKDVLIDDFRKRDA